MLIGGGLIVLVLVLCFLLPLSKMLREGKQNNRTTEHTQNQKAHCLQYCFGFGFDNDHES
jgi:hypothetical protein